ncbi:MAG TPA: sarcosine oxidase subunit gamma family protein [Beijerinckiaceae bacterium]|nr:sarcosine oxidase subunit gamma family protein [Beijerinckiaceae bacterium]
MTATRYAARVVALPMCALFEARGAEQGLRAALDAAGFAWPAHSGVIVDGLHGSAILRFGPARVLIRADLSREAALADRLEPAFATVGDADVARVSDMYAVFQVAGSSAEDVLRQGAPLDLSADRLPQGSVVATELWAITAFISRDRTAEASFTLMVERSYAGYVADWLAVANGGKPAASPGVMTNPPRPLAV